MGCSKTSRFLLSKKPRGSKEGSPLNSKRSDSMLFAKLIDALGRVPTSSPAEPLRRPTPPRKPSSPGRLLRPPEWSSNSARSSRARPSNCPSRRIASSISSILEAVRPMSSAVITSQVFHAAISLSQFLTTFHCSLLSFCPKTTSGGQQAGLRRWSQFKAAMTKLTPRRKDAESSEASLPSPTNTFG